MITQGHHGDPDRRPRPIRHGRQERRWDAWPRADRPVLVRSACPSVAGLPVGDV